MAQPVAQAAPAMQKMMVTVPSGCYGGQPLQVQTPAGLMQVRLPPPPPPFVYRRQAVTSVTSCSQLLTTDSPAPGDHPGRSPTRTAIRNARASTCAATSATGCTGFSHCQGTTCCSSVPAAGRVPCTAGREPSRPSSRALKRRLPPRTPGLPPGPSGLRRRRLLFRRLSPTPSTVS